MRIKIRTKRKGKAVLPRANRKASRSVQRTRKRSGARGGKVSRQPNPASIYSSAFLSQAKPVPAPLIEVLKGNTSLKDNQRVALSVYNAMKKKFPELRKKRWPEGTGVNDVLAWMMGKVQQIMDAYMPKHAIHHYDEPIGGLFDINRNGKPVVWIPYPNELNRWSLLEVYWLNDIKQFHPESEALALRALKACVSILHIPSLERFDEHLEDPISGESVLDPTEGSDYCQYLKDGVFHHYKQELKYRCKHDPLDSILKDLKKGNDYFRGLWNWLEKGVRISIQAKKDGRGLDNYYFDPAPYIGEDTGNHPVMFDMYWGLCWRDDDILASFNELLDACVNEAGVVVPFQAIPFSDKMPTEPTETLPIDFYRWWREGMDLIASYQKNGKFKEENYRKTVKGYKKTHEKQRLINIL